MATLTILIVFFTIGVLMALHELGHFLLAKKFGVRVEEFGLGYPPRVFGKKIGDTIYSINWIPFGAFVRIDEKDKKSPQAFSQKPIWQRALILAGGVFSFWIISVVLLSIVFSVGTLQAISDEEQIDLVEAKVQIMSVAPDSPADEAGLRTLDTIKEMELKPGLLPDDFESEGIEISKMVQVQDFVEEHKGKEITLTIIRGDETKKVSLTPRVEVKENEGAMGVSLIRTAVIKYPFWLAPIKGFQAALTTTWLIIRSLVDALAKVGQGLPPGVQFTGPIGVGVLMSQALQNGWSYFFQFVSLISLHLAIFNLLPIPAVDGGRLLFLMVEGIRGKPIKQEVEEKMNIASFVLLLSLMIFVTIKDLIALF